MTRESRLLRTSAAIVTLALGAAIVLPPWRPVIAASAALLVFLVGTNHVAAQIASFRSARPSVFDQALAPPSGGPQRPPDLESLERMLGWKTYSRRDFDHRVRPVLYRLLAYRLSAARGINLETQRDAAAQALPAELVWLLDDAGAPPASSIDTAAIDRMLEAMDAL
ncbi:hypothetical protein BH24ACT26_BH24ACT26_10890 [soil metagenome]